MEYRTFICVDKNTTYEMPFEFVIQAGVKDWTDAAEIYRSFVKNNYTDLLGKISAAGKLPNWISESPLVLIYPVRGEKDTGNMDPNSFFPYDRIMPIVEKYSKELDTKILVLLMHWEGTAPWAPPYIWPPFGGEEMFAGFVEKMHDSGNLVGLYASGIGWTDESVLVPEYTRKAFREDHNLIDIMCTAPDQSVPHAFICNGPIRWGYDMCPANPFVKDCILTEISKVMESKVDYLQYFDQNLGGTSYLCYSKKHGHLPVHGKWAVEAMSGIYRSIGELARTKNSDIVIGCEAAGAECYIDQLTFSDLRYNINFFYAKPVPAYAYVYHEYVQNFMGNQNSFNVAIPGDKNPLSLHFRMAYSFIAGDLLTGVLNGKGEFFWDWGTVWTVEGPEQQNLLKMVRSFIKMRHTDGKKFLVHGRMMKIVNYHVKELFELIRADGTKVSYPDVLASAWEDQDKNKAQVFANFSYGDKQVILERPCRTTEADGRGESVQTITVPEFSCVLIEI